MRTIRQTSPSKSWRLIRLKSTGDILTDEHSMYQMSHTDIKKQLDETQAGIVAGIELPKFKHGHYYYAKEVTLEDYEQLDHIPVMRGDFEFKSIHNGKSSIQIYFKSRAGGEYTLKGDHANDFFLRVGKGHIQMSLDGFYTFNYTFTKASTKVFMLLEPDNAHI